jgi:HEAT repeat protein
MPAVCLDGTPRGCEKLGIEQEHNSVVRSMNEMDTTAQRSHASPSEEPHETSEQLAQGISSSTARLAMELRTKDQPQRERAISSLVARLADPSPVIRLRAADELVKIGVQSRHLLKEACSAGEPTGIAAIQKVLSEIDRLWDDSQLPEAYQMAAIDPEMKEAIHIEAQEAVIDLSRSALELLGGQESALTEVKLLALLEMNTDRQCFALRTLVSLGEKSLTALEPFFADPNVSVRRVVANAGARIGGARAVELMVTALKDEDVFVRDVAAAFLADSGTQQQIQPVSGS